MEIILFTNNLYCRKKVVRRVRRLNPLSNTRALLRLNPYAAVLKREAILSSQKRQMGRDELLAKKRKVSTYCN
jgi:large subunit ribosomal protein L4e